MYPKLLMFALMAGCAEAPTVDTTNDGANDEEMGVCEGAEIGRCGVAETLLDCTGAADEVQVFVPLKEGDSVGIVQGFQGATMFALAARVEGIDPGGPEKAPKLNPLVDLEVLRTEYSAVGRLRTYMVFSPDTDLGDHYVSNQLYVLLGSNVESGQELTAFVEIEDANGVSRCGSMDFVAE